MVSQTRCGTWVLASGQQRARGTIRGAGDVGKLRRREGLDAVVGSSATNAICESTGALRDQTEVNIRERAGRRKEKAGELPLETF